MQRFRIITLFVTAILFIACKDNKSSTQKEGNTVSTTQKKANLIDGFWELNYMDSTPQPLDSLFLEEKPGFKIEKQKGKISGFSGCNNFSGNLEIEDNEFSLGKEVAVTRKMCPDMTGEDLFLKNLQKITSYSVTNRGRTLNLISDDRAIMRLERKNTDQ
ncbi:MAG: META domain-containing protein [Christiangramia sp.]|nr:META domain-containing protein [Christiangramia sp.]